MTLCGLGLFLSRLIYETVFPSHHDISTTTIPHHCPGTTYRLLPYSQPGHLYRLHGTDRLSSGSATLPWTGTLYGAHAL